MFPMVSSLEDLEFARSMLEQAHRSLQEDQLPHAWPVPTGVMIEVPSAALIAERLAKSVDFFSIGTNDLTQYTLAAERGHPKLIEYQDALHPSVLRLMRDTAQAGRKAGKWTGVCGELAGDPAAVPILIGLGIEELSLAPLQIPHIKEIVRLIDSAAACTLAENALQAGSAREVRRIAEVFLQQQTPKPPQT
jgi:phosphoenolpyruvate-protein kinase (PTS system EI component)